MSLSTLIAAWNEAHREFAIAFEGMPDEDLWRRPHPRLLSVGEIAGHVAHAQAVWVFGGGDWKTDLTSLPIKSPLIDASFRYCTVQLEQPVTLELGSEAVLSEVKRIHEKAMESVATRTMEELHPYWQNWGNLIQYQVFHTAYHTGQIYSARHMLGHETEDN